MKGFLITNKKNQQLIRKIVKFKTNKNYDVNLLYFIKTHIKDLHDSYFRINFVNNDVS